MSLRVRYTLMHWANWRDEAVTIETGRVPTLAELADRLAIQEVLAQHSRGVDRADEAILISAYWPDAEVNTTHDTLITTNYYY